MSSNPASQILPSDTTPLSADYALLTTTPTPQTYMHLRSVTGMSPRSHDGAVVGLPNSLYAVQIQHIPSSAIVGMGRIIGDDGLFYQIVDIAVDPGHQWRGLGKAIMGELMRWIEAKGKDGGYVSLMADGEAKRLYKIFGFEETAPVSVGMYYRVKKEG
ncbi:MAG: hypothetical protein Q9165_001637 [Trypethelium subeluteriae]